MEYGYGIRKTAERKLGHHAPFPQVEFYRKTVRIRCGQRGQFRIIVAHLAVDGNEPCGSFIQLKRQIINGVPLAVGQPRISLRNSGAESAEQYGKNQQLTEYF